MKSGKRVLLKDETVITTQAILEKVKACEEATKKKNGKDDTKRKSILQAALDTTNDVQGQKEQQ